MVSIQEIAQMTKTGDVQGLSAIFQRAEDWDARETVVAALGNVVWGKGGDFDRAEMIEALSTCAKQRAVGVATGSVA